MPILGFRRGEVSKKVIAVGDPERAKIISDELLENAKVINETRGLWCYTGDYKGEKVSIVTHGIGMPSASIVFEEIFSAGARVVLRLGTTGALRREVRIGDVVLATSAAHFNSSAIAQYFPKTISPPNATHPEVTLALKRHFEKSKIKFHMGPVVSTDSFYAESKEDAELLGKMGFLSIEMECAMLSMLGWLRGFKTGCVLYVTDSVVEKDTGLLGSKRVNRDMLNLAKLSLDAILEVE